MCLVVVKCMVYGFGKTWGKTLASSLISCIILSKLLQHSNFNFLTKNGKHCNTYMMVLLKGLNEYKYMYMLKVY